ncbi:MAG TPA: ribonuclease HII [Ramlibacter sp.]|nr:ribonuclease HII [Ramlibacter sp.]
MPSKRLSRGEQARLAGWEPVGLTAGVDEAGRGPLAGPVVAAAVILDDAKRIRGLADSKILSPLQREKLYDQIRDRALCCSVGEATVDEIDELNIFHATMLAMKRAVDGLRLKPARVLVDGNRLPRLDVYCEAIVEGDAKIKSISAASIIAKVHRDRILTRLHDEFPHYGFAAHKGYSTPEHLEALRLHGACRHHRRGFSPVAATFTTPDGTVIELRESLG